MVDKIMLILMIVGKTSILLLIFLVICKSIKNHGQPKVTEYNVAETLTFNLLLIVIYTISGIFDTYTHALIILGFYHLTDILITFRKNGAHEFSTFNAYKSSFLMIFYFLTLYLVNFWSPVLKFIEG